VLNESWMTANSAFLQWHLYIDQCNTKLRVPLESYTSLFDDNNNNNRWHAN